jgi:beta-glucanase (GH16 family)
MSLRSLSLSLICSVFLLTAPGCVKVVETTASPPPPSPYVPTGFDLVFNDEFEGSALNNSKWWTRLIHHLGTGDTLNDELERYRESNNHIISGGTMKLAAYRTGRLFPQYTSGMLRSKMTFKYGYFEARMKIPRGLGTWAAFWLNPSQSAEGSIYWPPEIDIVESVINADGREEPRNSNRSFGYMIHSSVKSQPAWWIDDASGEGRVGPYTERNPNFSPSIQTLDALNALDTKDRCSCYIEPTPGFNYADDFHVFAALWDSDNTVSIFIDGILVWKRPYDWFKGQNYSNHPGPSMVPGFANVIFNLAIGGNWPQSPPASTTFPQQLEIDYLRVYQRSGDRAMETGADTLGCPYTSCPQ